MSPIGISAGREDEPWGGQGGSCREEGRVLPGVPGEAEGVVGEGGESPGSWGEAGGSCRDSSAEGTTAQRGRLRWGPGTALMGLLGWGSPGRLRWGSRDGSAGAPGTAPMGLVGMAPMGLLGWGSRDGSDGAPRDGSDGAPCLGRDSPWGAG